jgi:hypothetical protein
MQRAHAIFENQGFKIRTFPFALIILPGAGKFRPDYLIPSTKALDWWHTFLKELAGRLNFTISN